MDLLRKGSLCRVAIWATLTISSVASASVAGATVVETVSTTSSYSYDFVPGLPGLNTGTGDEGIYQFTGSTVNQATDIKIDYASLVASDASFFFLHNIQCKGYCSVGVVTTLVNTVTNTGSDTAYLRLDSNITAGHFGLVQNAETPSAGMFEFNISELNGSVDHQLYNAIGQVSSSGASITTSDGSVFDGLTSYQDPAQIGLDWDETLLSALLAPLGAGETTVVTYKSLTYLSAYGLCLDVTHCDGVQVAFGDPRNKGGIIGNAKFLASANANVEQPVGYVLDRGFDGARIKLNVVEVSAVPEPDTWVMMIGGLGITGAALRRRRSPPRILAS